VVVVALVEQDWELGAMAALVLSSFVTLILLLRQLPQLEAQQLQLRVDLERTHSPAMVQLRSEE
jgi:hypothetical protein